MRMTIRKQWFGQTYSVREQQQRVSHDLKYSDKSGTKYQHFAHKSKQNSVTAAREGQKG